MTIVIIPATSRTNTFVINALLSFPRPPSIRLVAHTNASRMRLQEIFALLRVEEYIFESGLNYTILQASTCMAMAMQYGAC